LFVTLPIGGIIGDPASERWIVNLRIVARKESNLPQSEKDHDDKGFADKTFARQKSIPISSLSIADERHPARRLT